MDIQHSLNFYHQIGISLKSSKFNLFVKFIEIKFSSNWYFWRFTNKTNLWDSLIGSATGSFTTQEGYDKVSALYVQRQGEFSSAEHIIEKSLKNIKEETKWSNENLPVIEKWLDDYLKTVNVPGNKLNIG